MAMPWVKSPATLERRLERLEARAPASPFTSRPDAFPPQSPEAIRAVLRMLVELDLLGPPPAGVPDRWREVRLALFGPDQPTSDDDQNEM